MNFYLTIYRNEKNRMSQGNLMKNSLNLLFLCFKRLFPIVFDIFLMKFLDYYLKFYSRRYVLVKKNKGCSIFNLINFNSEKKKKKRKIEFSHFLKSFISDILP